LKDAVLSAVKAPHNKLIGKWISTDVLIAAVNSKYNFNNTSTDVNSMNIGKPLSLNNQSIDSLKHANADGVYRIEKGFKKGRMHFYFFAAEETLAEQATLASLSTITRSTRRSKRDKKSESSSELSAGPKHPVPDNKSDDSSKLKQIQTKYLEQFKVHDIHPRNKRPKLLDSIDI
jgi:hypothetical protein